MRESADRLELAGRIAATVRDCVERSTMIGRVVWFFDRFFNMQIRQERPSDAAIIRFITESAFKGLPHSDQTESKIIDALRAAGALTISLIAIQGGEVIGHVAFSPVAINGKIDDWYGLGPLSVRPEHQKKGVGQALARDGLHRLMSMKAAGCVVYGNPRYYGRFGFESDTELYYGNVLSGYLQRVVFSGPTPRGEVTYLSVIR